MQKFYFTFFALTIFTLFTASAAEPVAGRVIKYPLNVRAGAGTKYTAVAQLNKHNPVKITAVSKDWLAIQPPDNCLVWVLARYIKDHKLTANVNLRSGPGTGYEALGSGKRGMQVQTHGQVTASGWVRISPPPSIEFYVGRPAIEADEQKLKKLPSFNAPGGRPLPNTELIKLESNFTSIGKDIKVSGYIYKSEDGIKLVTHILYEVKGEDLIPKYFMVPSRGKISVEEGKEVTVSGECFKVKNWELPVLITKIVSTK